MMWILIGYYTQVISSIGLPDCTAVRNVLKGRRFQKMTGRRILCGGKEGQKVAIDFCIHSEVALKKVLRIFSREGAPDAALKKSFKNRIIQNIIMT